jgi:hypothetical protein
MVTAVAFGLPLNEDTDCAILDRVRYSAVIAVFKQRPTTAPSGLKYPQKKYLRVANRQSGVLTHREAAKMLLPLKSVEEFGDKKDVGQQAKATESNLKRKRVDAARWCGNRPVPRLRFDLRWVRSFLPATCPRVFRLDGLRLPWDYPHYFSTEVRT